MSTAPSSRFAQLDGLRGLAILLVVFYHFTPSKGIPVPLQFALQVGWVGVDLFFVLSGFLITGILLEEVKTPGYYGRFVARRSFRIFPLYYVSLLLIGFVVYQPGIKWGEFLQAYGGWWFLTYLGNFYVVKLNSWPALGYLIPLWSLQVEEQFYVTYPFLVGKLREKTLVRALVAMVVLALVFRVAFTIAVPDLLVGPYVLMPCRMDSLAMGGLIAVMGLDRKAWTSTVAKLAYAACGLAFLGIWWVAQGTPWPATMRTIGYSLIDIAFAGLLLVLLDSRSTRLRDVFSNRPLVAIGRISYGMYLLHLPAAELARRHVEPRLGVERGGPMDTAICVAATIVFAAIAWVAIESPFLKLRDRLVPRVQRSMAI